MSILPTSPRLRRILAAYTVNKLGTWFGTVALSLAIYDHTHSAAAVTALFVARYLPALAVPALVARVEASTRRRTLSALYAFEAACAVLLAALVWHFLLPAILVLVALDGAVELTASRSCAPRRARAGAEQGAEQGIYNANAALNIAMSASVVIGPALGALAVRAFGGPVALLIDAGSFLACAALVVNLYVYVEERTGASVRARLASAWEYVHEAPTLRAVLLTQAAALVFFETADAGGGVLHEGHPARRRRRLRRAAGRLGRGAARRQPPVRAWRAALAGAMLTLGTLAVGLAYLGFAAAPTLALAALAALLGGVGNGVQWASLLGTVQLLTPERLHGRLMGGVESIGALCPLIGLPLSGLVMALSSPRAAFAIFGAILAATTVGFARLWATGMIRAAGPDGRATQIDALSSAAFDSPSAPIASPAPTDALDSPPGGSVPTTYSGSRGV